MKESNKQRWKNKTLAVKSSKEKLEETLEINDAGDINELEKTEARKDFKFILTSKTIWVNLMAIIAFVVQSKTGFVIDETIQVYILSGINLVLRLVTKTSVTWK